MGGQVKSYEVLHLSRQIILANLQIWSSKMQPVSRDQRPGLTPCLTHVSLVLRPPRGLHLSRSSSNAPSLPSCLKLLQNPHMCGSLWASCIIRGACHTKRRTSKSGPNMMWCFENFDLEICFAPQQRALLKHVKVLGEWCVLYIWLRHFCFAPQWRRCFSTSQLPSVLRGWGVFHLLTWKCASCHNSVHSLNISTSKSCPRPKCFQHAGFKICFAPRQRAICYLTSAQMAPHPLLQRAYFSTRRSHKTLEKHSVSRLSTFSRTLIFFLLTLSLL